MAARHQTLVSKETANAVRRAYHSADTALIYVRNRCTLPCLDLPTPEPFLYDVWPKPIVLMFASFVHLANIRPNRTEDGDVTKSDLLMMRAFLVVRRTQGEWAPPVPRRAHLRRDPPQRCTAVAVSDEDDTGTNCQQ